MTNSILDEIVNFKYAEGNLFKETWIMLRLFRVWLLLVIVCICAQSFDFYIFGKTHQPVQAWAEDE